MLRKIDCVMIRVDDVEAATAYYARVFDLKPRWRDDADGSVGLGFPETDAEIVLHRNAEIPSRVEVHYLVDDVPAAVDALEREGCRTLARPFDIAIGKCAVIEDPFGVRFCVLDMSKGPRSAGPFQMSPRKA